MIISASIVLYIILQLENTILVYWMDPKYESDFSAASNS